MPHTMPNGDHPELGVFQDVYVLVELRVEHTTLKVPGVDDLLVKMNEVSTIARLCEYINRNTALDWFYGYTVNEQDLGKIEIPEDSVNAEPRWSDAVLPCRGLNIHANFWEILYLQSGYAPTHAAHAPTITWVLDPRPRLELREGVTEPHGWTEYLEKRETVWGEP